MPRASESTLAAIKQAVDLVALAGDYGLSLHRAGSKFKALCPFHDDHNPSLEINPERQSYKCWSCGAGGDVYDFVRNMEKVEFPEALRMLSERAGIALLTSEGRPDAPSEGPTRSELLAAAAWAEGQFAAALADEEGARAYAERRGISRESIERFRLGAAPDRRDWLQLRARRAGQSLEVLEAVGLVVRNPETGITRDRFRGRLIFPIRDISGRPIGFGGRILPEVEKTWTDQGKSVAKYLNSPETRLFHKRQQLYSADLARDAARKAGWVAVVEGYTDVIAAHQVGLTNVVGSLGTALGDDHITVLRRLADRVVLVFDGDEAGQKAADRSLELFLNHDVDVRVLALPSGLDPCDFLLGEGAEPFRALVDAAVDPLDFAVDRATARFDVRSIEGARQAADWVLGLFAQSPRVARAGITIKVGQALNKLADRLHLPVQDRSLVSRLQELLRRPKPAPRRAAPSPSPNEPGASGAVSAPWESSEPAPAPLPRVADLDPIDRELVQIVLDEPACVPQVRRLVPSEMVVEPALRTLLQVCYDLHAEGVEPTLERVSLRLDPALRAFAAGLLLSIDPAPMNDRARMGPLESRLSGLLARLAERERQHRLRDLKAALAETDPERDSDHHRALRQEYLRVLSQRPVPRKTSASS